MYAEESYAAFTTRNLAKSGEVACKLFDHSACSRAKKNPNPTYPTHPYLKDLGYNKQLERNTPTLLIISIIRYIYIVVYIKILNYKLK